MTAAGSKLGRTVPDLNSGQPPAQICMVNGLGKTHSSGVHKLGKSQHSADVVVLVQVCANRQSNAEEEQVGVVADRQLAEKTAAGVP